jgi:hypothetical protein
LNIACSVAFGGCSPNVEVAEVAGVVIAEYGVMVALRGCRSLGNVVATVGPEMEATYPAEEIHMEFHLVEGSLHQVVDLGIFPFDPASWILAEVLSSGFGQWGFVGVELASSLEHSSYAAVFAETLMTGEHYSVKDVETVALVSTEVRRWFQLVEGQYLMEVLHEAVSNGDLSIHCFELVAS